MTPNTQPPSHPVAHGTFHQTAAQNADTSAADVATVGHQNAAPSQEHSARQSSWHTPAGVQRHGASVGLRRLSRTAGRVVYDRTHRGASVGVRRLVGVLALGAAGLGVAACAPSNGIEAVSGVQSTVERQMSGEYILNPDGTLSKIPVYVHEPELQSNAYTYSAFGAEQAAKHYLALVAYGWETGDTQPMKDFATDECSPCGHMAAEIDELYAAGGWSHGVEYRVNSVLHSEEVTTVEGVDNTIGVVATVSTVGSDRYENSELTQTAEHIERLTFFMQWDESARQWHVSGMSVSEDAGDNDA